jgi:hypothetical protein
LNAGKNHAPNVFRLGVLQVVGWGMNEMGQRMTNVPRAAHVPVVSSETCRKTHPEFEEGITENNFCAGNRDGL